MLNIFSYAYLYISSLVRCLFKSFACFLTGLTFMSSSYVLDNSPLLYMSFASVFSQYMACFLILFQVSFTEEFLTLMKSSLSIISFMDHAFDVVSKVSSPYADSSRFSPMLSSWNFIVCVLNLGL